MVIQNELDIYIYFENYIQTYYGYLPIKKIIQTIKSN